MDKKIENFVKNTHKSALVPIEAWEYNSPFLKYLGKASDIGSFAEALIYYEKVYVVISTPKQFEEFVMFFVKGDKVDVLIELIKDKVINFFYYTFLSTAMDNPERKEFSIWNFNFTKGNYQHSEFIRLVVNIANLPISSNRRHKLWKAIVDNVIDEDSSQYNPPILDAKDAMQDGGKVSILVQAYLDNIYKNLNVGKPPVIETRIDNLTPEKWNIVTNYNFRVVNELTQNKLDFRQEMPLIGEVQSNRLIWTSLIRGHDLFLGDVMSQVVGNKLEEAEEKINKAENVIDELKARVEFPDIRSLVNNGSLSIEEIFNIRIHADKFRTWLQQEGERDRDAIIAYHNEVTKASGIRKRVSSTLKVFGVISGGLASPVYQAVTKDLSLTSNIIAGGAGLALGGFLNNVASSISKDWRPVVFGEWIKKEIK